MKTYTLSFRKACIPDPREALRRAWVIHRPLTFVGLLMTWQALRAVPVVAPDALTFLAVAGTVASLVLSVRRAWAS
jgi:hypothetical protein